MPTRTCELELSHLLAYAEGQHVLASTVRRGQRFEFRHPVRVIREQGRDGRAVSYDITESGMGLFAPFRCEVGEQLHLRVSIPDRGTVEHSALVVRVDEIGRGLWEVGCLFRRWADEMPRLVGRAAPLDQRRWL